MKVAIPTLGKGGLDCERSGHFGHCDCFTVVDVENGEVGAVTDGIHGGRLDDDLRQRLHQDLQREDHVPQVLPVPVLLPEHIRVPDLLQRVGARLRHPAGPRAPELGHARAASQDIPDIHAERADVCASIAVDTEQDVPAADVQDLQLMDGAEESIFSMSA